MEDRNIDISAYLDQYKDLNLNISTRVYNDCISIIIRTEDSEVYDLCFNCAWIEDDQITWLTGVLAKQFYKNIKIAKADQRMKIREYYANFLNSMERG